MKKKWNLKDIAEHEIISDVKMNDQNVSVVIGEQSFEFALIGRSDGHMILESSGSAEAKKRFSVRLGQKMMSYEARDILVTTASTLRKKSGAGDHGGMISPMPGKVFKVLVTEGDEVKAGAVLLILEAMKMEHSIKAPHDGIVRKIHFKEGELVDGGVELATLEEINKG